MNNPNGTPTTVRELYFYIKSEFQKLNSIQCELTEHKANHWKMVTIMISILSIYVTILTFLLKNLMR